MNLYESEQGVQDNLIAGYSDVIPVEVVVVNGEGELSRGAVLGLVTGTAKDCKLVDSTENDGTQTAYAILAQDVDASAGDIVTVAYIAGEFNENELTFGGNDTADTHRATLQAKGIVLRPAVGVV